MGTQRSPAVCRQACRLARRSCAVKPDRRGKFLQRYDMESNTSVTAPRRSPELTHLRSHRVTHPLMAALARAKAELAHAKSVIRSLNGSEDVSRPQSSPPKAGRAPLGWVNFGEQRWVNSGER